MSRIFVLCYEYPPIGGGGGRVAAQVAEALVERGHHVRVITAGMPHLPHYEIVSGVEVIRVHARRQREDTCTVLEMLLWVMAACPVALREAWRLVSRGHPCSFLQCQQGLLPGWFINSLVLPMC